MGSVPSQASKHSIAARKPIRKFAPINEKEIVPNNTRATIVFFLPGFRNSFQFIVSLFGEQSSLGLILSKFLDHFFFKNQHLW